MEKLVDALAGNEISVARYYAKRGAHLAAANRAQNIITGFQNTRFTEEALAIMEVSYRKMNRQQLADDTRRILQQTSRKALICSRNGGATMRRGGVIGNSFLTIGRPSERFSDGLRRIMGTAGLI